MHNPEWILILNCAFDYPLSIAQYVFVFGKRVIKVDYYCVFRKLASMKLLIFTFSKVCMFLVWFYTFRGSLGDI